MTTISFLGSNFSEQFATKDTLKKISDGRCEPGIVPFNKIGKRQQWQCGNGNCCYYILYNSVGSFMLPMSGVIGESLACAAMSQVKAKETI